jgi:lysine biosynthesis protein LysW
MSKSSIKVIAICPDCNSEIRLRKAPHLGQTVVCANCHTNLEVVNRSPLELDWVFEDPFDDEPEEEWDDEEYDYDDWDDDDDDYDDWDDDDL